MQAFEIMHTNALFPSCTQFKCTFRSLFVLCTTHAVKCVLAISKYASTAQGRTCVLPCAGQYIFNISSVIIVQLNCHAACFNNYFFKNRCLMVCNNILVLHTVLVGTLRRN